MPRAQNSFSSEILVRFLPAGAPADRIGVAKRHGPANFSLAGHAGCVAASGLGPGPLCFEACAGFTHVTARRIAQPPKVTFVRDSDPVSYPTKPLASFRIQSTTIRVESSSTDDSRLGAHCQFRTFRRQGPPLKLTQALWLCREPRRCGLICRRIKIWNHSARKKRRPRVIMPRPCSCSQQKYIARPNDAKVANTQHRKGNKAR